MYVFKLKKLIAAAICLVEAAVFSAVFLSAATACRRQLQIAALECTLTSMPAELEIYTFRPDKTELFALSLAVLSPSVQPPLPQKTYKPQQTPAPTAKMQTTKDVSITQGQTKSDAGSVYINNETSYTLQTAALFEAELPFQYDPSAPQVLIVHTHTSESYLPSEAFAFTPTDNSRTQDCNYNVARVGEALAQVLTENGVNVLHDKAINDYPSYNGSYQKSLELIESYTSRYPSIQVVIDLHRDSMETAEGVKLKTKAVVNGEATAQVMLVVGTDANGLEHPNWRTNLSWAMRFQDSMNRLYPGLARPINLRNERFNGHAAQGELILEVGTTGNTLDEAIAAVKYAGVALAEVIKAQT